MRDRGFLALLASTCREVAGRRVNWYFFTIALAITFVPSLSLSTPSQVARHFFLMMVLVLLVLAAGMVDRDYRSRQLWLIFTKPANKGEYLLARGLGTWIIWSIGLLVAGSVLSLRLLFVSDAAPLEPSFVVSMWLGCLYLAFLVVSLSAWLPFFSNSVVVFLLLHVRGVADLLPEGLRWLRQAVALFARIFAIPAFPRSPKPYLLLEFAFHEAILCAAAFYLGLWALRHREPGLR